MLDKVIAKLERTDSTVWTCLLGVLATLLLGWAMYSRRTLQNRKDILKHRATRKAVLAGQSESAEDSAALYKEALLYSSRAEALEKAIEESTERLSEARSRIDAARTLSDLNNG